MANAAELAILIHTEGADKAKGAIEGVGKSASGLKGAIGGAAGALGSLGLAGMGVGVITGAVGAAAGAVGDLIGAAEGLGDAQARVNLVFGESNMAKDWAIEMANGLGMTQEAYISQVGALGQLTTSLGVNKDAALDMSAGFTELAPKLAAYAGVEGDVASSALEGALLGKTKGLAALGIAITDADLAAAAMREGIQGEAKDWTEAERAQAMYAAVMEKTGAAQEAWADNQGDVEVSMQRITAAMDDAKATIGEKLLPVIAPLVQAFADELPGAIDLVMDGVDLLGGAFDDLMTFLEPVREFVQYLINDFETWVDGSTPLAAALGVISDILKKLGLEDISKQVEDLSFFFHELFQNVGGGGDIFQSLMGVLNNLGLGSIVTQIQGVLNELRPTLDAIASYIQTIMAAIVGFIREHWTEISAIINGVINIVRGTIEVGWNIILGIIRTVMALIRGDWDGAWQAMKDMLSGVISGVGRILDGLVGVLVNLGSILLDEAKKIGANIANGIKDALQGAWDGLVNKLRGLVDMLPQVVKDLLGIASPSKVFEEIGDNIMRGLAIGIEGGGVLLQRAMESAIQHYLDFSPGGRMAQELRRQTEAFFNSVLEKNNQKVGTVEELIFGLPSAGSGPGGKYKGMAIAWEDAQKAAGEYYSKVFDLRQAAEAEEDPDKKRAKMGELYAALEEWEKKRHELMQANLEEEYADAPGTLGWMTEAEAARHDMFMKHLADQRIALEDLNTLFGEFDAERERAQKMAMDAVKARQADEEDAAKAIHDRVMAWLDAEMERREQAHDAAMAALDAREEAEDSRHDKAMAFLDAEEKAIADAEAATAERIDDMRLALDKLKMDLGIDAQAAQFDALTKRVSDFYGLMGDLQQALTGKEAAEAEKKASADRVKLVSDEQRRAVREALAGGKIVDSELRRQAQLWAGGAAIRRRDADEIIKLIGESLQREADAQGDVVEGLNARVKAREDEIARAELLAKTEADANEDRLAEIEQRRTAEAARHAAVVTQIEGERTVEAARWDDYVAGVERARKAEKERFDIRMQQIDEEYALQLLRLQYTDEEVARILAEQHRRAQGITDEAARLYQEYMAGLKAAATAAGEYMASAFTFAAAAASTAVDGVTEAVVRLGSEIRAGTDALDAMLQRFDLIEKKTEPKRTGAYKPGQTTRKGRGGFKFSIFYGEDNPDATPPGGGAGGALAVAGDVSIATPGNVSIASANTINIPAVRAEVVITSNPIIQWTDTATDKLATLIERKLAEKFVLTPVP